MLKFILGCQRKYFWLIWITLPSDEIFRFWSNFMFAIIILTVWIESQLCEICRVAVWLQMEIWGSGPVAFRHNFFVVLGRLSVLQYISLSGFGSYKKKLSGSSSVQHGILAKSWPFSNYLKIAWINCTNSKKVWLIGKQLLHN